MNLSEFLAFAATRRPLDTEEIGRFMDEMSDSARRITFELNGSYHTPDEVRALLSRLFGYEIDPSVRVFPPFYTDFGRNIAVGKGVFINACCHFQDHGGVTLGDGCQIGHNVVFATLDHGIAPAERRTTVPAPIVLGRNVWVGSNATILRGVTIGDNAVIGAGAAGMLLAFFSVGGLAHGLMTGELTGALATPLSWVPLAWPARLGSLGVEAFIDAVRAAGPLLTTALAGLVLTLAADAVLFAWFCRFEDGRADA